MGDFLRDYQMDAVNRMRNGCILNGGVGSGKSRTSLYYYFKENGGSFENGIYVPMTTAPDLYIITTAQKRDKLEWEAELIPFLISPDPALSRYSNKVTIDSWNNIQKYKDVTDSFFIFDEDRICGTGAWSKAFLKIAKTNRWIVLSATPGDKWEDYITIFMANGFYRTITEFKQEHLRYDYRCRSYPKVIGYYNIGRLMRLRDRILIDMDFVRDTVPHHEDVIVDYDILTYKQTTKTRTDPFKPGYIPCDKNDPDALVIGTDILIEDVEPVMFGWDYEPKMGDYVKLTYTPITSASDLCYVWRKIVNSHESRAEALLKIFEKHPRIIVFYNYDYELDILRNLPYGDDVEVAEWNGHKHQPIPESGSWVYLTQYIAGCEGWNCLATDTMIFYSQTYSYKVLAQACGRIDRMNTPYRDLYYYHLKTRSPIDIAIYKALKEKKKFNETKFVKW